MSQPIFPFAVWQSGTNENSIPANDNALRIEVLIGPALGVANSEPVAPAQRDQYVVGTAWGGFTTDNVVIYLGGTWLEWEVFEGWVKVIGEGQFYYDGEWLAGGGTGFPDAPSDGETYGRQDGAWVVVSGGGGSDNLTLVTEASPFTANPTDHAGRSKLVLAAGNVTFDSAESYAAGQPYNLRATGSVTLATSGVTLTPPAGGTLSLSADMAVTVVMTSGSAGIVIGQTVPA